MYEFELAKKILRQMENDVAKFDEGNNTAGTRVRKAAQEIKQVAQQIREAVVGTRTARGK